MIPTTKCGQCHFQDDQKICQNIRCLSYKERVLDGYVACYMFELRQEVVPTSEEMEKLKPGKCEACLLEGKCRLNPGSCPGTLDKGMSKILMNDPSPMGSIFKKLIEDIMTSSERKF